jgi:sulfide:quinone oxidoreductase
MTKIIELEPGVCVAPQLVEADFAEISAAGFKVVVNNRPDGEAEGQMSSATARAAAHAAGLGYHYQPAANIDITDDDIVAAFAAHLTSLARPVLFYCRSGTRCTLLWAQSSAKRLGAAQVEAMAAKAGYDVSIIRDLLEERAKT